MRRNFELAAMLTLVFAVVGALLAVLFVPFLDLAPARAPAEPPEGQRGVASLRAAHYLPPDPREAPSELRELVLYGREIVTDTRRVLGDRVRSDLDCESCHFEGGLTRGGQNGGFSLVGSAARYPRPGPAGAVPVDLATRINLCLTQSLNAQPLDPGSREMTALLAYHHWISKGIGLYQDIPWIPIERLATQHAPDAAAGASVFELRCSMCHGREGQGTATAPPLWGPGSFTAASPMADRRDLPAFVLRNMPRQNPLLEPGPAVDVAAFVLAQPRPEP